MQRREHIQARLLALGFALMVGCAGSPSAGRDLALATPSPAAGAPVNADRVDVPFRTLARGFRLGGNFPQPTLQIATDAASLSDLSALVDPGDRAALGAVDLQRDAVLAVFSSTMPTGGFSIEITALFVAGDEITADVRLREDDPALPRIEAATTPYHLVVIERSTLPQTRPLRSRIVSK